ncbi:TPA: glycosyltransferase family 52, partial [Haemophilus influenzae]
YDQEKLVIKTHPRETTNYRNYFPNIEVFSENYPSEILDVLGIRFEKVVTIFSTAVYVYPKEDIIFYGTKIHPKLLSRFGRIEYE